ncbi:ankyrin repeat domain-containing protein [Saccharopolyspora erythraea]|uniref:ankyrin repeat domain-containing protein n=1 Tax=Saccharopolyspora erythraea TaxID=1836 RepID=UPI001BA54D28|nr:ankyrin repeat domain-containing protein [Saccharopolyspora erythraea]
MRARLDAGADPNTGASFWQRPLHFAAEHGSSDVVAELARRVDDIEAETDGHTALWLAVYANRPGNARALAEAGADPWRPMMSGWPPGRLALASPTPELFGGSASLSPTESAAAVEGRRLTAALGEFEFEGMGLACVAGIDVAEAVRRLGAEVVDAVDSWEDAVWGDPFADWVLRTMWATDVPGGCVIAQPWGYVPSDRHVTERLSEGTTCYAMYANPKSGNQGSIVGDGEVVDSDLHPGGDPFGGDPSDEILASYLYRYNSIAYCCAYVGLRPADNRAFAGPPDAWLRLPEQG